uniref:Uncharacterized protein n=1 Tax=Molossus molossus TaxID=27622 RepID=A0A7J8JWM7_MOLMO|nr:hypothetical protein HJG59_007784 [Molossus molossus]
MCPDSAPRRQSHLWLRATVPEYMPQKWKCQAPNIHFTRHHQVVVQMPMPADYPPAVCRNPAPPHLSRQRPGWMSSYCPSGEREVVSQSDGLVDSRTEASSRSPCPFPHRVVLLLLLLGDSLYFLGTTVSVGMCFARLLSVEGLSCHVTLVSAGRAEC